jgi:UDP-glucose 4-epimerase
MKRILITGANSYIGTSFDILKIKKVVYHMIEVVIDHSYEDDYYQIDTITVNLADIEEKQRIEKVVKERKLEGILVEPFGDFIDQLAKVLGVTKELIDIDTNEID